MENNLVKGIRRGFGVMSLGLAAIVGSACGDEYITNEHYYPGSEPGQNSPACGYSPMVNRYLWNLAGCEVGMTTPVDPESCTAYFGDLDQFEVAVDGTTIKFPSEEGETYSLNLVKSFSCSEIKPQHQEQYGDRCGSYKSCLNSDSELWVVKTIEGISMVDNLWKIMDEPWPGTSQCRDSPAFYNLKCGEL